MVPSAPMDFLPETHAACGIHAAKNSIGTTTSVPPRYDSSALQCLPQLAVILLTSMR